MYIHVYYHPDYNVLAGRIVVSIIIKIHQLHVDAMKQLYSFKDKHGNDSPLISKSLYDTVMEHGDELDNMIDYNDYLIDYFGFKTLEQLI